MKEEDYPPQEPLGDLALAYRAVALEKAAGITGIDASYGEDPYQSVAVYPADVPNGEVMMHIHGGGWTSGYKEWMAYLAPPLNALGVTYVSVGYRLAPMHLFPAGVDDCMDAVAWVYHHIAEHGGDPKRIFIGGHSAGGHYASLLAVRRDWQAGREVPDDVIRGCLPVSGVFDFGENSGMSMQPRFLNGDANIVPASPVSNIQGTPPPFFISYGEKDFPHLKTQAMDMHGKLAQAGTDVSRIEIPGADHLQASYACGDAEGPWLPKVVPWMQGH